MALRNLNICLRYTNRESLLRSKFIHNVSSSHFSYINNPILVYKRDSINYKKKENNKLLLCYASYNPNFIITRSLSIETPQTHNEINKASNKLPTPSVDPEEIAKIVQEVHNTAIKSAKQGSLDNSTKKTEILTEEKDKTPVVKLSLVQKIKHNFATVSETKYYRIVVNELRHYYHGFRLFLLETKITCGILLSIIRGHTLTRRERKQLVRTVADLFRLVPFAVFIIVPCLEILLPLYIKFFPFMMPSTFKEKSKEAEKMHQLLKGKLEMAKFLQDTLDETINVGKYKSDGQISLETFNHFMKQARESGHTANTDDILKFSRLFEDEVTLESLDHKQVKALCKLLDINSIGPKALLNFHLRMKVHQLKVDDKMIMKEGISKIPTYELQQLCRERGMRAIGVSEERLRYQLRQWLNLSIENQVPISLLLLSRTMYLPESVSAEEQLSKTILILPELVSKEASLLTSSASAKFDNKTMFEVIKEEEAAIKEEKRLEKETLVDKAPIITVATGGQETETKKAVEDESISASDLAQLETAIESLAGSQTSIQEEELDELKEQAAELTESVVSSVAGANKLSQKLQGMIQDMDVLLDKLDVAKESLQKTAGAEEKEGEEEERMVAIGDLMKTLRQVKSVSHDEGKWRRILEMLDEDHDGQIEVHHVMEVLDLVDSAEIRLSSKELKRVLDAIDKEEVIERQEEEEEKRGDGGVANRH